MTVSKASDAVPQAMISIELLIPEYDVAEPVVTLLVPALNEELTIGRFIDWCHEGVRHAGVPVEVMIVDSSSDRTARSREPRARAC